MSWNAVAFLSIILFVGIISANKRNEVAAKDEIISHNVINMNEETTKVETIKPGDEKKNVEVHDVLQFETKMDCAEIGQFCDNNSDCCSNSCLGFLKRCVSSSD